MLIVMAGIGKLYVVADSSVFVMPTVTSNDNGDLVISSSETIGIFAGNTTIESTNTIVLNGTVTHVIPASGTFSVNGVSVFQIPDSADFTVNGATTFNIPATAAFAVTGAHDVHLSATETIIMTSPTVSFTGELSVPSIRSEGNLAFLAGVTLSAKAPSVTVNASSSFVVTGPASFVVPDASDFYIQGRILLDVPDVTRMVVNGAATFNVPPISSFEVTGAHNINLAATDTIAVSAPTVSMTGTLTVPSVRSDGSLTLVANVSLSAQAPSVSVNAFSAFVVTGPTNFVVPDVSEFHVQGRVLFDIPSAGQLVVNGATNISVPVTQSFDVTVGTTAIQVNAGTIAGTAATSFSIAAPTVTLTAANVNVAGYLKVTPPATIPVTSAAELVAAWSSLQGQPLQTPVTIQLMNNIDVSGLQNNFLLLANQPYGSFITIQGNVNDKAAITISGALCFVNVVHVKLQYVTLLCVLNTNSSLWPAITVGPGSSINANNIGISGQCGYDTKGTPAVYVADYDYRALSPLSTMTSVTSSPASLHLSSASLSTISLPNYGQCILAIGIGAYLYMTDVSITSNAVYTIQVTFLAKAMLKSVNFVSVNNPSYCLWINSFASATTWRVTGCTAYLTTSGTENAIPSNWS